MYPGRPCDEAGPPGRYQPKGKDPQVPVKRARKAVRELVSLYQEVSR